MKCKRNYYPKIRRNTLHILMFVFSFVLLLTPFNTFAADEEVNFSGEWTLNESKSNMGEGRFRVSLRMTINQEGNNLSIERVRRGRDGQEMKQTENLTLDGKECENNAGMGTRKSTAIWSDDGKMLTISSTMVFDRGGETMEMKSVEIWKLTDDGKSLSIESTSSTPRGERKATLVYDKK